MLKETTADIEISTVVEDCPKCGAFLANTLTKQNKVQAELAQNLPRFQTAFDLTKFEIDIEKISKIMPLSTKGTLCIAGYKANLLITRLCVRALLPANYGGLGSSCVIVVDAGNKSDFYQTVNFVKQYGLDLKNTLDRIIVSRTFTIYQLKSLLQRELPKVIAKYQPSVVIIPGLLDLFEDPNIKKKVAKLVIARILKSINNIASRLLVITSINESDYAKLVISNFDKRISLSNANRNRISAELYNSGKRAKVALLERELKIVRKTSTVESQDN